MSDSESEDHSCDNESLEDSDSSGSEEEFIIRYTSNVLVPLASLGGRIPRNTSVLSGTDWMAELICGTETRFFEALRLRKDVFFDLVKMLVNRGLLTECQQTRVSSLESVAIFMQIMGHHVRMRQSEERFQHSLATVHRHVHRVVDALLAVLPEYIKPWDYTFIPPRILNSHRNYPYFEGAVGALDGTLIPTRVPLNRQAAFRSRKGGVAQNVAAICDFDMNFNYVVAGWEGSASDAHILQTAIERDPSFPWPPDGRYYLVDAGYSNYSAFLAPYRNTRYHLPEFQGTVAAQTPEELFNHRHASLRNCIERAFGLLKSRFALLRYGMPCFRFDNQVNLTLACCVVHNFVNQSRLDDPLRQGTYPHYEADDLVFSASEFPTPARIRDQSDFRDEIAAALWENR